MDGLLKDLYNTKDKQKGLTTTLNGQVLKYDVSVDQNQSFRCTLEFVSSNYHYNNSLSKTTLFSIIDNSAACPIATALRPSSKETSASEFFWIAFINCLCS